MKTGRLPLLLAALALSASLAACSAGGEASGLTQLNGAAGSASDAGASAGAERSLAVQDTAPQPATLDGTQASALASEESSTGRSIIRSGAVTLAVEDAAGSASQVRELADSLGGYIESQNVGDAAYGGASLALRVPSARFDEAFEALAGVGKVLNEDRSSVDVTEQRVDLQARIDALQTSIDRLTQLMAGAANTSDLLQAESALTARQAELDSLQAQLTSLEGQIDEASIVVSLTTESVLPGGGPANFWEGLVAGVQSIGVIGAGLLVVLGVLLPWLLIAAVITLALIWIVRKSRPGRQRRAAQRAQRAAGQQATYGVAAQPAQQPQQAHQLQAQAEQPEAPTPGA